MAGLKIEITSILIILFLSSCSSGVQKTVRVEHVVCQPICGDDYMLGGPSGMALSDSKKPENISGSVVCVVGDHLSSLSFLH